MLIGTFIGTQALGYYAMAFQIASLPQMVLSGSVYLTLFSATSDAQREGTVSAERFLNVLRVSLLLAVPMLTGIAATAPLSVPLLLGDKWLPMVPLIWLLVPLGIAQAGGAATGGVLLGLGLGKTIFRLTVLGASSTILAILIGVQFGSNAVALGVSVTALLGQLLSQHVVKRACGATTGEMLQVFVPPLTASVLMGGTVVLLQRFLPDTFPTVLSLGICILAGILIYGTILTFFFRQQTVPVLVTLRDLLLARVRRRRNA